MPVTLTIRANPVLELVEHVVAWQGDSFTLLHDRPPGWFPTTEQAAQWGFTKEELDRVVNLLCAAYDEECVAQNRYSLPEDTLAQREPVFERARVLARRG